VLGTLVNNTKFRLQPMRGSYLDFVRAHGRMLFPVFYPVRSTPWLRSSQAEASASSSVATEGRVGWPNGRLQPRHKPRSSLWPLWMRLVRKAARLWQWQEIGRRLNQGNDFGTPDHNYSGVMDLSGSCRMSSWGLITSSMHASLSSRTLPILRRSRSPS
jgi:hypothetical protein